METDDFLAHQMDIRRPVFMEHLVVGTIFNGGQIVQQSVEPYVYHVLGIKRHLDAPVKTGTGDAQIFQTLLHEVDHLVAAGSRLDEIRMLLNIFEPAFLVLAHLEKITFFLHLFHGAAAVRALAVYQLTFQPERFARHTVPAFVVFLVNIALVKNFLHHGLHHFVVTFLAGTQKIIVADVQTFPQQLEVSDNLVHIFLGRYAFFFRLALNLLAVLIAAGQKENIFALSAMITGDAICHRGTVSVADM